jgi:type IV pilus assembly protein PilP
MKSAGKYCCGILMLVPLMVLNSGCAIDDRSELEKKVQNILSRPPEHIAPLPEIKPYVAYTYKSGKDNARDPFQLFYEKTADQEAEGAKDTGLTAEMEKEIKNRNREELEGFELDSLRMVGTIEDQNTEWGIIRDPVGTVHRVKVGNYMGRNIGKILNIYEDRIELREIIRNPEGRWEERQASIALAEK